VAVVYFFMYGAVGALAPYLTLYYRSVGLSGSEISILVAVQPILLLVAQPIFGPLTDRSGHRGRMLSWLFLVVAATGGLMGFGHSFWTLLPLAGLWSFFVGLLLPIADSIALGEVARTGVSYPRLRLWGSIGFLLVSTATGQPYGMAGLRAAFPLYAFLQVVSWFCARRLPADDGASARRNVLPALKALLQNRVLAAFLLTTTVLFVTLSAHSAFFTVHLASIGGTSLVIGIAWAFAAFVEIFVWLVLSQVMRRIGYLPLLTLAAFGYALRWWLTGSVVSPWAMVGVQMTQMVTWAILWPTAVAFVGEVAPPELRTSAQSLLSLATFGVATLVGSLMAGRMVDQIGTVGMYGTITWIAVAAGLLFAALTVTVAVKHRGRAAAQS